VVPAYRRPAQIEMGARGIDVYSLGDPGLDSVFNGGDIERQLRYINIPALVRYKLRKHVFFEIGPMFGILTKATDVFYNSVKKMRISPLRIK